MQMLALRKEFNSAKISVMACAYETGNKLKLAYWHCKECYGYCIFVFKMLGKVERISLWWTDEAYCLLFLQVFFFHYFFLNLVTHRMLGRFFFSVFP